MTEEKSKKREKIEAEIARSLSVVKMKESHKQIEDIEKSRKQASIKSICERISSCMEKNLIITNVFVNTQQKRPKDSLRWKLSEDSVINMYLDSIVKTYESICFDFETTIALKKEDFDRLFPKIEFNFNTIASAIASLNCLNIRLQDMKSYCLRLL